MKPNKHRINDTRTLPETQAPRHILDRIVETKRAEVEALRRSAPELRAAALQMPPARDFRGALSGSSNVAVIAEVKRRSPGAGVIKDRLDPVPQALAYQTGGAAAISVLTDHTYFGGSLIDLETVRASVPMPVLRKDFMIDPLQVDQARAAGADAILLIVRILEDDELDRLYNQANELGMAALVEVHDRAELARAASLGAAIIGINNRDLSTFRTDLAVTLDLLTHVPAGVTVVSESGISGGEDVDRLGAAGIDAVLVGEWLVRQSDPAAAAAVISGRPRAPR